MAEQAFVQAYKDELKQLTGPDKARINTLSMLAEDNRQHAQAIVTCIEKHLHECVPRERLPALYLMDSIIKNVREPYKTLFSKRLEHVFGRVWDSTLPPQRESLSKLVRLWTGHLAPDVLARLQARMAASSTGQQAPAAVPVLQQSHPQQQPIKQQQPVPSQQQPVLQQPAQQPPQQQQVLQPAQFMQPPPGSILVPAGQPMVGGFPVVPMQPVPAQQPGIIVMVGPNGQLVPVGPAPPQPQPQLIAMQQPPMHAIPQHMLAGGLPPVSPAHPSWGQPQQPPQQQQQQQALRPMQPHPQQQPGPMVRRSPAYPASPAVVQASPHHSTGRSPHHRSGTSPQHMSAPGSSARSGSPAQQQAEQIAASLSSLLQGLTKHTYLNDPALKTTSFDPAFIKKEHKGVIALLKAASDNTRARFKDIQFQRNKRRKAAAASSALHSRSWYLPVNSWITGTTTLQQDTADEQPEEASEEEGPAPPPTVDADPSQHECAISREPFDSFYDQDRETWVYRGAVRLTGEEAARHGVPDGSIVKVECLAEADLGSSPAALAAAAAAAGSAGGAEDEADLAAAALAAPAAGQQQQQQQQQQPAAAGTAAAEQQQQQQQQPPAAAHVKVEPEESAISEPGGAAMHIKQEPGDAAAAGAAAAAGGGVAIKQDIGAAAAAAAGVKRDLAQEQQQQQDGTPSKKPRVSPEP